MHVMFLSALAAALLPTGDSAVQPNPRPLRAARWSIVLPQNNPEAFLKKLQDLKAYLLLPDGESSTTFQLCDNLAQSPPAFRRIDRTGVNALNRLWFHARDESGRQQIAAALRQPSPPAWFALFIPPELETEMVKQEVAFQKLSEEELFTKQFITVFDITRQGDVWHVKVTYQGPRQK